MRCGLAALKVSLGEPVIPLARQRSRVLGRQQPPFAFFLGSDVGDAALDFRKPLTVQRARLNDRCAWSDAQTRFPSDTVEPFILVLNVFGDALPRGEAAALGWGELWSLHEACVVDCVAGFVEFASYVRKLR